MRGDSTFVPGQGACHLFRVAWFRRGVESCDIFPFPGGVEWGAHVNLDLTATQSQTSEFYLRCGHEVELSNG